MTPPTPETTGLNSAIGYAEAVATAHTAHGTNDRFTTALSAAGYGPAALAAVAAAQQASTTAAASWTAAAAALAAGLSVRDAYTAAPDAGAKHHLLDDDGQAGPGGDPHSPDTTDPELRQALIDDDNAESRGMHPDERETCPTCRTWTSQEHIESAHHLAQIASTNNPRHATRTRDRYASVTDPQLQDALIRDDLAEDYGMHADDRETCHSCQTWATDEHLAAPQHQALTTRAMAYILSGVNRR